MGIKFLR